MRGTKIKLVVTLKGFRNDLLRSHLKDIQNILIGQVVILTMMKSEKQRAIEVLLRLMLSYNRN